MRSDLQLKHVSRTARDKWSKVADLRALGVDSVVASADASEASPTVSIYSRLPPVFFLPALPLWRFGQPGRTCLDQTCTEG